MRIIVAGGRDFNDYGLLSNTLDHLFSNLDKVIIVSGKARGADSLGEQYAKLHNLEVNEFPADWNLGKGAGHIRNAEMADNAEGLVLFWNGVSRGSKGMLEVATKKGLEVKVIRY